MYKLFIKNNLKIDFKDLEKLFEMAKLGNKRNCLNELEF